MAKVRTLRQVNGRTLLREEVKRFAEDALFRIFDAKDSNNSAEEEELEGKRLFVCCATGLSLGLKIST